MKPSSDTFFFPDEPINGDRVSTTLQLAERLPESYLRNPKLPSSFTKQCQWCNDGYLVVDGKPNCYWLAYRCRSCGKSMLYIEGMDRKEWRRRIDPFRDEPVHLDLGATDKFSAESTEADA